MITQSNFGLVHPSCEVLVNGQIRKLYGKNKNKVYLNNGDEIQLKVYNPLTERVGFQLKMNGNKTDDSILVVNPGQSVVIERFIGTNRKIVFNTYVVDKSNPQTKQAIKENGKLEVVFYSEYKDINWTPINIPYNTPTTIPYTPQYPPYTPNVPYTPPYNPFPIWYQQPINICNNGTTSGEVKYRTTTDTFSSSGDLNVSNFCADVNDITMKGNIQMDGDVTINGNVNLNGNLNQKRPRIKGLSETGRIEKGNRSNQYFSQTEFKAGFIIKNYLFKLLPFSEKPKDAPTQTTSSYNPYILQNQQPQNFNNNSYVRSEYREYCPNKRCNYRIRKSNWSYCPICGQKID